MSKILITGGAGFLGSNLADYLHDLGHNVTICDIEDSSHQQFAPYRREIKDVCVLMKELDTIAALPGIFGKSPTFDIIYHFAAVPHLGVGILHPESTISNNINTLLAVLGYCRQHPTTRLIFASSSSVKWAEYSSSPHAESKRMCEQTIQLFNKTYQMNSIIVRIYNVYGDGEADYGSFTPLIKKCRMAFENKTEMLIHGDGTEARDFVHISDAVTFFALILDEIADNTAKPVYEVGLGAAPVSVLKIVKSMLGDEWPITFAGSGHGIKVSKADRSLRPARWRPDVKVLDWIQFWIEAGRQND